METEEGLEPHNPDEPAEGNPEQETKIPGEDKKSHFADSETFTLLYNPVFNAEMLHGDEIVDDPDWTAIDDATYWKNLLRISLPLEVFSKDNFADLLTAEDYLLRAAIGLQEFIAHMHSYLLATATAAQITQADLYEAVKVLAYGRGEDEKALLQALKGPSIFAANLEFICANVLQVFAGMDVIHIIPRPICNRDDKLSVRLLPYAHLLPISYDHAFDHAMGLNPDDYDLDLPTDLDDLPIASLDWLLDLFHEIGHYLYWKGRFAFAQGQELEEWTIAKLKENWLADRLRLRFEEIFCDFVAIALGGPLVAITVLKSIIGTEIGNLDRCRMTLRLFLELYGGTPSQSWASVLDVWHKEKIRNNADWNDPTKNKTKFNDPAILPLMNLEFMTFLNDVRSAARSVPFLRDLQDFGANATTVEQTAIANNVNDTFRTAIFEWLKRSSYSTTDIARVMGETTRLCNPNASTLNIEIQIKEWQNQKVLPFQANSPTWYSVLQADGWSTRGPRSGVGD